MRHACDNCGRTFKHHELKIDNIPDIPNLFERLTPGGIVPSGECPACGALVYPEDAPPRDPSKN